MKKTVLFLTSTVNPKNIKCSDVSQVRKAEYVMALQFYLSNTNFDILIVDNSGYNYAHDFNSDRLECLSYHGHSSDEIKGKGYCEAILLKYGFEHSRLLKDANQIVKITGRLIINNINTLVKVSKDSKAVYADSDIHLYYPHSYFFIASYSFFVDYLFSYSFEMNDSKGIHFEHILGKCIKLTIAKGRSFHQFRYPIDIIGHPGGSSVYYKRPSIRKTFIVFCKYMLTEMAIFLKYKINL